MRFAITDLWFRFDTPALAIRQGRRIQSLRAFRRAGKRSKGNGNELWARGKVSRKSGKGRNPGEQGEGEGGEEGRGSIKDRVRAERAEVGRGVGGRDEEGMGRRAEAGGKKE